MSVNARQIMRWRRRCTTTAMVAVVVAGSAAGFTVGVMYALDATGRPSS